MSETFNRDCLYGRIKRIINLMHEKRGLGRTLK